MIIFQVLLNFDQVKVILKIRCQIYILMTKTIILRKIQVQTKAFAPSSFNRFCLTLNRKKTVVMEGMTKKLNMFTLKPPTCYILE